MSEDRPWPIRDTLPEDSILRTFVDSLFEAGVILSFKKVLWTNPKTNLWTFGFTCVCLVWFSAPKWYFVWQNGVNLRQSWRLLGNMVRYRPALQWPGCEDVEGGGECNIWLFWDLLYGQCERYDYRRLLSKTAQDCRISRVLPWFWS